MKVRLAILSVLAGLVVVALGIPAFGAEHQEGTTTETTISSVSDREPALVIKPEEEIEPTLDWTYRYLIPASLVMGAAVILLTSVKYFTDVVRKRYRIVE